jgi:hypothetical protein
MWAFGENNSFSHPVFLKYVFLPDGFLGEAVPSKIRVYLQISWAINEKGGEMK